MASEYQIMAMMADLKIQLHAQEALSWQYDNKAKTATGEQKQELKNKANAHRDTAEKLKKDIEDLKKRLEKQKQVESTQTKKWGKVVREAASILTLSGVATTAILLLLFDGKTQASQCLRPGARSRILQEMTMTKEKIYAVERKVYELQKDLDEAESLASRTYFLFSHEIIMKATYAQLVTIPKLKQEIQYGQNLMNQSWQLWNRYNDYLKLPDCEQDPPRRDLPRQNNNNDPDFLCKLQAMYCRNR